MITIDKKYDVILTYSPIIEITGHIFECFDYYLFLRNYYKVGILFFGGLKKDKLKIAWDSKYTVPFELIEKDLIIIDNKNFGNHSLLVSFSHNTVVFLTDGNIESLRCNRIILMCKHLVGFLCEDPVKTPSKQYSKISYLQDYRIYGRNNLFHSYDYVKKLPFKYYKKSSPTGKNIGMMYVTFVCRKITPDVIRECHEKSGCSKTLLIVPYKLSEYENIENVEQRVAPIDNFFDCFDTYIYTPVQRHFDCSPRLVTECFLNNKKVIMDLNYKDIGLQTRYNDCVNNFESLNLKDDDQILKIIQEVRND